MPSAEHRAPRAVGRPPGPTDVRAALAAATARLAAAGVPSARFDAEVLAAHLLGCERGALLLRDELDATAYDRLVARREAREPLQHLTGRAYFRHVELAVGPGVFVPRPETEVMTGWVIDRVRELDRPQPLVVDLCSGSGAIALALASEVPDATVHAVELDPAAHAWAERNLTGSGVVLHLGGVTGALPELDGLVDAVVANPPYIPLDAWESVQEEARDHDPGTALWGGGEDGLDVVREVARVAARLLRDGGIVAVEHADAQGESAPAVFRADPAWTSVQDHPDLARRPRFVTGRRAPRSVPGQAPAAVVVR